MAEEGTCSADESLARARAGDSTAFAGLVRKHQGAVYSLALRMLSDRHKAEELAQEVFLQLHRKLDSIESDAHLGFWLRKVTTHRAIDLIRQQRLVEAVPLEDDGTLITEAADEDLLLQKRLRELVAQLPPAARAVMLLRYQEDLDPTEIAETLEMSIHTVKSHLKRSLATLRSQVLGMVVLNREPSSL